MPEPGGINGFGAPSFDLHPERNAARMSAAFFDPALSPADPLPGAAAEELAAGAADAC